MIGSWLVTAAVVAAEAVFYVQYAGFDGQFHFWLHGLLGAALGLTALTAARLTAPRRDTAGRMIGCRSVPWVAGFLGHLYSAFPDVLFLTAGVPHQRWMNAFAFHITAHFLPAPILTALAVFLLALVGYGLAMVGRRRTTTAGIAALGAAALVATWTLATAEPIPDDIEDLRTRPGFAEHHTELQ
jgi:hypothetical protein